MGVCLGRGGGREMAEKRGGLHVGNTEGAECVKLGDKVGEAVT